VISFARPRLLTLPCVPSSTVCAQVVPGETALAFFTAKNPTKKHITGVATYNVFPLKAGECPLVPTGFPLILMGKWELRSAGHRSGVLVS